MWSINPELSPGCTQFSPIQVRICIISCRKGLTWQVCTVQTMHIPKKGPSSGLPLASSREITAEPSGGSPWSECVCTPGTVGPCCTRWIRHFRLTSLICGNCPTLILNCILVVIVVAINKSGGV